MNEMTSMLLINMTFMMQSSNTTLISSQNKTDRAVGVEVVQHGDAGFVVLPLNLTMILFPGALFKTRSFSQFTLKALTICMINISQCNAPLGFSVGNKSQVETECSLTSIALIVLDVQLRQLARNPGLEMTDTTWVPGRAEYTSHLF